MLKCFDLEDRDTTGIVAFAQDRRNAILLGTMHFIFTQGRVPQQMTAIERQPAFGGPARDYLITALNAGVFGIGHLQRDGSWIVLPWDMEADESVTHTPTSMHHRFNEDFIEVVLFTYSIHRADDIYHALMKGSLLVPEKWFGSAWEAWQQDGLVRHQVQAETRGVEGVGVYTPNGWQILPLDYLPLAVDNPGLPDP
jgi:hypothetical protein